MSTADCRQNRCACATKASALHESARTIQQSSQWGHRDESGQLVWQMRAPVTSMVSPVWAKHIEALRSAPDVMLHREDGWLVYRVNPHVEELADYSFGRIRWDEVAEMPEVAEKVPSLFEVTP